MSVERLVKGGICHCSEVSFRDCGGTFVVCLSTQTAICGPEVSRSDSGAVTCRCPLFSIQRSNGTVRNGR